MAAPGKKRAVETIENKPLREDGSGSSAEESSDLENMESDFPQEHIQVDFEGRNPCDSDFHGIKQLLQQLFLKAHIDLSQLTDLIISQNYVGSVVKQSLDEEDDDDDDDNAADDVFGITSVVNLTEKQHLQCVQQLRTLLVELCDEHGSDQSATLVRTLLGDDSQPVGLVINERFINIPAKIAVPLLETLNKEMKRAADKKMPFNFAYFIVICKLYKVDDSRKQNKKKGKKKKDKPEDPRIIWSNPEEAIIYEEAECFFEFSVKDEADSGLGGQWLEDDVEMIPYRRVLLLSAKKFESAIERIKSYLA